MRILAVDDDEFILELLVAMLEAHGYNDVTQAISGEDAIRKIAAAGTPFDCFMFDIQMPGMDGIELCKTVRGMDTYRDTPVVMITAMSKKEYIDRAFLAGATDYVTKPFDTTELISRIRLADKLQSQSQKIQQSNTVVSNPVKPPFKDPVMVEDVHGVVNVSSLENYLKLMLNQSQTAMSAFAVRVPELEQVHAGSSSEEFTYVVTDISEVLTDVLVGAQAMVSYLGNGMFLCVVPKRQKPSTENMQDGLMVMLNDPDLVYCEDVKTGFSVQIGEAASPKLLERSANLQFLDRAIDNLKDAERKSGGSSGQAFNGGRSGHSFAA